MTGLSNYARDKMNDHLLAVAAFTQPTAIYVALHIGDPGDNGTGNPGTTTLRKVVTYAASASGTAAATGTPVARWDTWGATEGLTHWSQWDALTAGNNLTNFALSGTINAVNGDPVELDALSVTAT